MQTTQKGGRCKKKDTMKKIPALFPPRNGMDGLSAMGGTSNANVPRSGSTMAGRQKGRQATHAYVQKGDTFTLRMPPKERAAAIRVSQSSFAQRG